MKQLSILISTIAIVTLSCSKLQETQDFNPIETTTLNQEAELFILIYLI